MKTATCRKTNIPSTDDGRIFQQRNREYIEEENKWIDLRIIGCWPHWWAAERNSAINLFLNATAPVKPKWKDGKTMRWKNAKIFCNRIHLYTRRKVCVWEKGRERERGKATEGSRKNFLRKFENDGGADLHLLNIQPHLVAPTNVFWQPPSWLVSRFVAAELNTFEKVKNLGTCAYRIRSRNTCQVILKSSPQTAESQKQKQL